MKTTSIRNCQVCGKLFVPGDIVYFVPLDNNIVCPECAYKHDGREKRIVEDESTCSPATTRYDALRDIMENMNSQQIEFYSIPEWAKYIAMDDNGKWWAFEVEPELSKDETEWNSNTGRLKEIYIDCSGTLREVSR